jgi:translation initiation factor IF-1
MSTSGGHIEASGIVARAAGGGFYDVELDNGAMVRCTLAGRLRQHHIRVLPFDRVDIHIGTYDLTKGILVYRHK